MTRTILALTLIVLVSSVTFATESVALGAAQDLGDLGAPASNRSLSSSDAGTQIDPGGNLLSSFSGVIPYLAALLY